MASIIQRMSMSCEYPSCHLIHFNYAKLYIAENCANGSGPNYSESKFKLLWTSGTVHECERKKANLVHLECLEMRHSVYRRNGVDATVYYLWILMLSTKSRLQWVVIVCLSLSQ